MQTNSTRSVLTRIRNVTSRRSRKKWGKQLQVAGSAASALGIFVAIWVAVQGQVTVDRSSRASLQQSEDSQLSTAITAIGSDNTAEEIAGLLLLARNTSSRFTLMGDTKESPGDVYDDYTTALQILSGYLNSHGETYLASAGTSQQAEVPFGLGFGYPPPDGFPLDMTYAADQVKFLLTTDMANLVTGLNIGKRPAIDLSSDELIGQPWGSANFGWVFAYLAGIDLRGANLAYSRWSTRSDLAGSYLQCADLQGADFRGADLSHANLSGADVQGADFRGADLKGAVLKSLYGTARWSSRPKGITLTTAEQNSGTCLRNSGFWRKRPVSASTAATSSPGPSSSPSGSGSAPQRLHNVIEEILVD
jgi:hypothetical protein